MENFIKEHESEFRKYIELTDKLNQLLGELRERKVSAKYYVKNKTNKMNEIIEGVSRGTVEINSMKNAINDYTVTSEVSDVLTQHNSEIKGIIEDGITSSEKKIDVMIENYKEIYNSDERIKLTSLSKSEEKKKLIDIITKKQDKLYKLINTNIQVKEKELEQLKEETKTDLDGIMNERNKKEDEIKKDIDKKEKIIEELTQQKYDNIKDETTRNRLIEATEKTINRLKQEITEKNQYLEKMKSFYSTRIHNLKDVSLANLNKLNDEIEMLKKLMEEISKEIEELTETEEVKQINTDKLKEVLSKTIDFEKEPEQNTRGTQYYDEAMEKINKSQFYYVDYPVGNINGKEVKGYFKCIRNIETGELEIIEPDIKKGEFFKREYIKRDKFLELEYIKYRINEKTGRIEKVKDKTKLSLFERIKNKINEIFSEEVEEQLIEQVNDEPTLKERINVNVSGVVAKSSNNKEQENVINEKNSNVVDKDVSDDE